jgi:DNA-binding MarR family transcriptional regulator
MFDMDRQDSAPDTREYLLQRIIEQLFSLMRTINRDIMPRQPFLSPPQARLAFLISRYREEGISVKDLAEKNCNTPGAVTQFVDALIEKGLVSREADPNDRRIVRLKTTPAAESSLHKLKKEFFASASQAFDVLQDDELRQLIALLERVGQRKSDS